MKLFLKGERCHTEKCAIEKRNFAPRPARQGSQAEDRRLRSAVARKAEGAPLLSAARRPVPQPVRKSQRDEGHHRRKPVLNMLERRLDNIIYRMGFGTSRAQARQIVRHGHIHVNGRKVRYSLVPGKAQRRDSKCANGSKNNPTILPLATPPPMRPRPNWIEVDRENLKGRVIASPTRGSRADPVERTTHRRVVLEVSGPSRRSSRQRIYV